MEPVYGFLQILLWVGSSLLPTLCVLFALSSPLLPACTVSLLLPLCLPHILLSRCLCQCRCLREQPQFPVPPLLEEKVLSDTLFSSLSQKMRWDHQNIISPIPTHSPAPAHCCVQPQAFCLTPVLHSVFAGQSQPPALCLCYPPLWLLQGVSPADLLSCCSPCQPLPECPGCPDVSGRRSCSCTDERNQDPDALRNCPKPMSCSSV